MFGQKAKGKTNRLEIGGKVRNGGTSKKRQKTKQDYEDLDDADVADNPKLVETVDNEFDDARTEYVARDAEQKQPYESGLVSECVKDIDVLISPSNDELIVFDTVLDHCCANGFMVCQIASKLSFMKKNGGRLL